MGDNVNLKPHSAQNEPAMKGWLFKWTNYLKGYQRRWFVLQNGHLSYYRAENNGGVPSLTIRRRRRFRQGNQAEMAHTCRGSISLHGALIYTVDACTFVISNGGTQTFHIKAASEVERQQWVTALELAKAKAIRNMESEEDEEIDDSGDLEDWSGVVRKIESQLNDLQTCADVLAKHWKNLAKSLGEVETNPDPDLLLGKNKEVCERATLFRIASNAMVNSCGDYLKSAQNHGHKLVRALQHEKEQRARLQEMVETLAQQHSKLEQAANARSQLPAISANDNEEEDDNEFYDALAEGGGTPGQNDTDEHFTLNIRTSTTHRRNSSDSSSEPEETLTSTKQVIIKSKRDASAAGSNTSVDSRPPLRHGPVSSSNVNFKRVGSTGFSAIPVAHEFPRSKSKRIRRTRIPDKPNYPLNLWSIMKNCIGKDLSKIPMPVNFNEPLSMLQRLTEDFEYAEILDIASKCSDPCEQLAYVAAFTISSYSTTSNRTGKPFNPLLGETYEADRTDDLGWRIINEQVSHHPPMVAQYCEGRSWVCWQEFTMTSKFRGKYLQVIPLGNAQVEFKDNNKYSWRKVTTTVHNIIVGKLWVDQHGDMEIIGRGKAEGIKCILKYIPYSYFTRDSQRRVKGVVMDTEGNVKWIINGTWDDQVDIAPVIGNSDNSNDFYQTGQPVIAWKRRYAPEDSEKYYNFTILAAQLNEMEPGVAPTDSRLRPDQRLMEEGFWEQSNKEKIRIEEKQRAARRHRESEAEMAADEDSETWSQNSAGINRQKESEAGISADEGRLYPPYQPIWFEQKKDDDSDEVHHVYTGKYWEAKANQDWSQCPDIF